MTSPEAAELEAVDAALEGRAVPPEHAELAELALLLRDDRPEPDPRWAAQLDRRAQDGFPKLPKPTPKWRLWLHPGTLVPVAGISLVALIIALAAVLPQGVDDSDSGGGGSMAEPMSGDAGISEQSGASSAGSDDAATAQEPASPSLSRTDRGGSPGSDARRDRDVQRSARITLEARPREIDQVASETGRIAADLGGFVANSSVTSSRGGSIQLRVPSARVDTAIERLSDLASVGELSRESRDITSAVVSARERLNDARAERSSLLRQLAAATTVNETESIRARLRIVSRQIASARQGLRSVNNQARFADIDVTLDARRGDPVEEGGAWTPGDAFDDALRVLEVTAGVALIVLAVSLPFLLAGAVGWATWRGVTRRRRERALDMA